MLLHMKTYTLFYHFFLEWKVFQILVLRDNVKQFMLYKFFLQKLWRLCENLKYMVKCYWPRLTVCCMLISYLITEGTNKH